MANRVEFLIRDNNNNGTKFMVELYDNLEPIVQNFLDLCRRQEYIDPRLEAMPSGGVRFKVNNPANQPRLDINLNNNVDGSLFNQGALFMANDGSFIISHSSDEASSLRAQCVTFGHVVRGYNVLRNMMQDGYVYVVDCYTL
ncbi:uncharacterized protein LOC110725503 [Chenopodium quinoa]|uniref:uncharacterized protein LOC110725503 n=1 Tax=Chenopodium quinoa TaxID=63459 RepID=UPI000B773475|nr:uncharacterized protein LOC110725503 [Chenopodium quinoa]